MACLIDFLVTTAIIAIAVAVIKITKITAMMTVTLVIQRSKTPH